MGLLRASEFEEFSSLGGYSIVWWSYAQKGKWLKWRCSITRHWKSEMAHCQNGDMDNAFVEQANGKRKPFARWVGIEKEPSNQDSAKPNHGKRMSNSAFSFAGPQRSPIRIDRLAPCLGPRLDPVVFDALLLDDYPWLKTKRKIA